MTILEMTKEQASEALPSGQLTACVVGLGYVGLPLLVILGELGFKTVGADKNPNVVAACEKGLPSLYEEGLKERLSSLIAKGRATFTSQASEAARKADVIFITVGTPLNDEGAMDTRAIIDAAEAVGKGLTPGTLVVLKSTVYPGAVRNLVKPILERVSGLDEDSYGLAFVPERTVEGRALQELPVLPKIIGGINEKSRKAAENIFTLIGGPIVPVSTIEIAEVAKLFDNIYRDVNIALVNELAILCESIGVDVIEATRAANNQYSRTHFLIPGIGVGGSCLNKDPYIFARVAETRGARPSLLYEARRINETMPLHFVQLVKTAFAEMGKPMAGARVAVLGYAMKGSTDDIRFTPVKTVIEALKREDVAIALYDAYVKPEVIRREVGLDKLGSLEQAVTGASAICIASDDSEFARLDLAAIRKLAASPCALIDGRHVVNPNEAIKAGFLFQGVGRPKEFFGGKVE